MSQMMATGPAGSDDSVHTGINQLILTDRQSFFPVVAGTGVQDEWTDLPRTFSKPPLFTPDRSRVQTVQAGILLQVQSSCSSVTLARTRKRPWDLLHCTWLQRVQSDSTGTNPLAAPCVMERVVFLGSRMGYRRKRTQFRRIRTWCCVRYVPVGSKDVLKEERHLKENILKNPSLRRGLV